jgi:hypothetical protein
MDLTLNARYFHNVSTTVSSRLFNNYSVGAQLNYKLAKSLSATAQYMYLHQTQSNTILLGPSSYNSNIVGASITYTWDHPLGR